MGYIVKTSFYEGDKLHEEGSAFEHSDADYIAKCLADGNIVDGEVAVEATPPATTESESTEDATSTNPLPQNPPVVNDVPKPEPGKQPTPEEVQATIASIGSADSSQDLNGSGVQNG